MPNLSSGEHMTLFDPHSPGLPSLTLQCPTVDDGFHNEHRVPLHIHVCLLVLSCLPLAICGLNASLEFMGHRFNSNCNNLL